MAERSKTFALLEVQEALRSKRLQGEGRSLLDGGDPLGARSIFTRALLGLSCATTPYGTSAVPALRAELFSQRALAALRIGWFMSCVSDCTAAVAEVRSATAAAAAAPTAAVAQAQRWNPALCQVLATRASAWEALGFERRALRDLQQALRHADPADDSELMAAARARVTRLQTSLLEPALLHWGILPLDHRQQVHAFLPLVCLGRVRCVCREWLQEHLAPEPAAWQAQARGVMGPLAEAAERMEGGFREEPRQAGAGPSRSRWAVEVWPGSARRGSLVLQAETEASASGPCAATAQEDSWLAAAALSEASADNPSRRQALPATRWLRAACFGPPVVLDIGTLFIKAGLAGEDSPRVMLNNVMLNNGAPIADEGLLTDDPSVLEASMRAVFELLAVDPQEHPVVLCLSSYQRREVPPEEYDRRTRALERCLVEVCGALSVHSAECAVLALLASGEHTGLVLDIGWGSTRVVPVARGQVVQAGIQTHYVGGASCTNYLLDAVQESAAPQDPEAPGVLLVYLLKGVKEDCCFVAASRDEALQTERLEATSCANACRRGECTLTIEEIPYTSICSEHPSRDETMSDGEGTPPDAISDYDVEVEALAAGFDRPVYLGPELAAVGELFFDPVVANSHHSFHGPGTHAECHGLHKLACMAALGAAECSSGVHPEELMASVVLAGGSAAFPGMRARLQAELGEEALRHRALASCRPRVLPVRQELAWLGGSLLGGFLLGGSLTPTAATPAAARPAEAEGMRPLQRVRGRGHGGRWRVHF